jgi:hypothetical protein
VTFAPGSIDKPRPRRDQSQLLFGGELTTELKPDERQCNRDRHAYDQTGRLVWRVALARSAA